MHFCLTLTQFMFNVVISLFVPEQIYVSSVNMSYLITIFCVNS